MTETKPGERYGICSKCGKQGIYSIIKGAKITGKKCRYCGTPADIKTGKAKTNPGAAYHHERKMNAIEMADGAKTRGSSDRVQYWQGQVDAHSGSENVSIGAHMPNPLRRASKGLHDTVSTGRGSKNRKASGKIANRIAQKARALNMSGRASDFYEGVELAAPGMYGRFANPAQPWARGASFPFPPTPAMNPRRKHHRKNPIAIANPIKGKVLGISIVAIAVVGIGAWLVIKKPWVKK